MSSKKRKNEELIELQESNKKTKKDKFFKLNKVNEKYVDICNKLLTDELLLKCANKFIHSEFKRGNLNTFKKHMREEVGKIIKDKEIQDLGLEYQKFRQEANEHIINWTKTKILEKETRE